MKVAIACGGTGGHLYPGVAIGESLKSKGLEVALMVSNKPVDQEATKSLQGHFEIKSFPAVGLVGRKYFSFFKGLHQSRKMALDFYQSWKPDAALAMGGFTSVGPILAARRLKIPNGIHEANVIPGRANKWLARKSDFVLLNFDATRTRLKSASNADVIQCGLPVRSGFFQTSPTTAKQAFGWESDAKVLLVTGGSQGAKVMNDLILRFRSERWSEFAEWKLLHLTGSKDYERMVEAYRAKGFAGTPNVRVEPFLHSMEQALASAAACVTRAGASFLGEMEVFHPPALLVPYPHAVENHQYWNAVAYTERSQGSIFSESEETESEFIDKLTEIMRAGSAKQPRPASPESKAAQLAARYIISRIHEEKAVA